jgi:GTP cyclohydrolase I
MKEENILDMERIRETIQRAASPVSQRIRERIYENAASKDYFANHNISQYIQDGELDELVAEVAEKFHDVLESLVIDTANDHNTTGTAYRVAKMFVNEVFYGRYHPAPKITDFPNVTSYDNLYMTGPITIRSTCAHHFQPIVGKCWVGVFPGETVIGLSKFNRIVDWVASRPQIQEEMSVQIADEIEKITHAPGVAVIVKAEHMCMTHRGVKEHESEMTTSIMRGQFRTDKALKDEFLQLLKSNGSK